MNRNTSLTFRTTRFRAKKDTPKGYKKICTLVVPSLRNDYNSGLLRVYKSRGGYRVSTFRDGCFYEQFAMAEFGEEALRTLGLEKK